MTVATAPQTTASFAARAAAVVAEATAHAKALGVVLDMDADEGRIVFAIDRGDAPKGSGAAAVSHMLALADAADVAVVLDVAASEPALVRYWWRFGFRLVDGDAAAEQADLALLTEERDRFLADPRNAGEVHPVTTMYRDRYAGPLLTGEAA